MNGLAPAWLKALAPVPRRAAGTDPSKYDGSAGSDARSGTRSDASALWAALCRSTEALFDVARRSSGDGLVRARRDLFLALELQCKLQELAVWPALERAELTTARSLRTNEKDVESLRELIDMAREPGVQAPARAMIVAALDNIAALQFTSVQTELDRAQASPRFDAAALREDMQALLARWRGEVEATGDIEDEDGDPVGLPPR